MKFTDGQWLLRPGVTAHYATEVRSITSEDGQLVIEAPVRAIRDRGDTLQGPLLTVTLSSPMRDVIRVRIEHFAGGLSRGPQIPIFPRGNMSPEIIESADFAIIKSGELAARIKKKTWALTFEAGGRVLTTSGWRAIAYMQTANWGNHVVEQLSLGVGEYVYGLGERFTAFVKNGQVVEIVNKDGGTASEQAYKNVPFYLTNRGYGVLVNDTGPISFEIASEKVARIQFSLQGESLEYFIIYGPTPKEVLRKLTALTGEPGLPPPWSFGLWLSTSFTTNYDEATVTSFIDEMKRRDLPLHVFHFDCFWMREFQWVDFEWDPLVFPDPLGMLRRLHDRGLKVCVWINPYIAQRSRLFAEAADHGYLIKPCTDGSVCRRTSWQPGIGIIDFSHPACTRLVPAQHIIRLLRYWVGRCVSQTGSSGELEDRRGRRICTTVRDPRRRCITYQRLWHQPAFQIAIEQPRSREAVLFAALFICFRACGSSRCTWGRLC